MKKLALRMAIPHRTGRILDVGSGNNPLDIATHLVDSMPEEDTEREGELELPPGKKFIRGSVENIPFDDKFFDFVHAAHILEHVESPKEVLKELTRVAYAGYIETPAPLFEQGIYFQADAPGWSFHRWFVWVFPREAKIYFKPKTTAHIKEYCPCPCGKMFQRLLKIVDFKDIHPLVPYYCKMTQFGWVDTIEFEIWNEGQQGADGKTENPGILSDRSSMDGCRCFYAAFFSHLRLYFKSWRYLTKRMKFKRKLPLIYKEIKFFLDRTQT